VKGHIIIVNKAKYSTRTDVFVTGSTKCSLSLVWAVLLSVAQASVNIRS
jgi:hypothetical protein